MCWYVPEKLYAALELGFDPGPYFEEKLPNDIRELCDSDTRQDSNQGI